MYNVLMSVMLVVLSSKGIRSFKGFDWGIFIFTEISPNKQQYVLVGDPLTLNCSLTSSYTGPLGVDSLYFNKTKGQKDLEAEQILLAEQNILQLYIPSVRLGQNQYECKLNSTSVLGGVGSSRMVYGGNLPRPVTNITCVNYNSDYMTCTWPCRQDDQEMTQHALKFTVDFSSWENCPELVEDKVGHECQCRWSRFYAGLPYHLNITSKNEWGRQRGVEETTQFTIRTGRIVKPSPISRLTAHATSSRTVFVSWMPPDGLSVDGDFAYVLHYRLTYSSKWTPQPLVVEMQNRTSYTMTELIPHTSYSVSVVCWPVSEGYESDPSITQVKTQEDRPASGPELPLGAYNVQQCPGTHLDAPCREVYIFWLELAEKYQNGPIEFYRIAYFLKEESGNKLGETESNSFGERLSLEEGNTYRIEIRAQNSKGVSPASTMLLTLTDNAKYKPRVVAETDGPNSNSMILEILPYSELPAPDNYTLLSCRGSRENKLCRPTDSPKYRVLPGNTNRLNVDVPSLDTVYSLSANWPGVSSGLLDWICVYDYDGVPGKPVLTTDTEQTVERCLHLRWQPLSCNTENRGRVKQFLVYYSTVQSPENVTQLSLNASEHEWMGCGLDPATNYSLGVEGVSRKGKGLRAVVTLRTPESAPSTAPYNVTVIQVMVGGVRISWLPPLQPNGRITKYKIVATGKDAVDRKMLEVNSVQYQATVIGLNGYVNYMLTVEAKNTAGSSPLSDPVYFRTPITAPSQVNQLSIQRINSTLARVSWAVPQPSHGPISYYLLQARAEDTDGKEVWEQRWRNESVDGKVTSTNMTVKCLESVYTIYVSVAAITTSNGSEYLGPFSDEGDKEMCSNSETKETVPLYIIGIIVPLAVSVTLGLFWYWWKKSKKALKTEITRPAPLLQIPDTVTGKAYLAVKQMEDGTAQDLLTDGSAHNSEGTQSSADSAPSTIREESEGTQSSPLNSSAGSAPSTIPEESEGTQSSSLDSSGGSAPSTIPEDSEGTQSSSLDSSAGSAQSTIPEDSESTQLSSLNSSTSSAPRNFLRNSLANCSGPPDVSRNSGRVTDYRQTRPTDWSGHEQPKDNSEQNSNESDFDNYSKATLPNEMGSFSGGYQGAQIRAQGCENVEGPAVPMFEEGGELESIFGSDSNLQENSGMSPEDIANYSSAAVQETSFN